MKSILFNKCRATTAWIVSSLEFLPENLWSYFFKEPWALALLQYSNKFFELVIMPPPSPNAPRFFPGKKLKVPMSPNVPTCLFLILVPWACAHHLGTLACSFLCPIPSARWCVFCVFGSMYVVGSPISPPWRRPKAFVVLLTKANN